MAKGKSGRAGTRDVMTSLTPPALRSYIGPDLTAIDDRRSFDFAPATRPARLFSGSPASITVNFPSRKSERAQARVPYQIAFRAPPETLVCVRRKQRKEVLHAKRKTGKGGQRRRRRSPFSNVRC